jgi:hypothetical protein
MTSLITPFGVVVETDGRFSGPNQAYQVFLDMEYHKVHTQKHFTGSDYDSDVDVLTPKYWHIKSPNTDMRAHLVFNVYAGLPVLFEVYKNPTIAEAGDGTPFVFQNNDLSVANGAQTTLFADPTITEDGTRIFVRVIGSTGVTPIGAQGGKIKRDVGFIMAQNQSILFKVTPYADNTPVSIDIDWFESEDMGVEL